MSSFVKDKTADGREVFKRSRPKLPPMRRTLAILLVSMQGISTKERFCPCCRDKFIFFGDSLLGMVVVIELKSDIEVSGVMEDTDPGMKVTLSDVKETRPDGSISYSEMMTIEGSAIRYVHIPRSVNTRNLLADYVRKTDRIRGQNQPHLIRTRVPEPLEKKDIVLNSLDD